jgi:RimJ/RimL family protein N-acetyltransferase
MTEACREVLRFAFQELGLAQVGICTAPENLRSQSVIRKCGFVYEGTIRHSYETYTGECRDSMCFSMLREEYEGQSFAK